MEFLYVPSPVGELTLTQEGDCLTGLYFGHLSCQGQEGATPLLEKTTRQLSEYFAGSRREFTLPLLLKGTPFQRRVWEALQTIPYGETCSYGELAKAIGSPKSCRAVGGANHRNPISIIVPCHRVVGASGSLTGYGGGLENKRFLLDLERRVLEGIG
jgi:methylated-DNA-[protein]-cysteine S-methyltransferase